MADNADKLADRSCIPCRGGIPPLSEDDMAPLLSQLTGWTVEGGHHLTKTYAFPDFMEGLKFVNRVGEVAESEGHHPDVYLAWGEVRLKVWTHKIDGLAESDFVFAAKADEVLQ